MCWIKKPPRSPPPPPQPTRYDTNLMSQMRVGKNWILPKETNANWFFWDSYWLEIWKKHLHMSLYGIEWRERDYGLRRKILAFSFLCSPLRASIYHIFFSTSWNMGNISGYKNLSYFLTAFLIFAGICSMFLANWTNFRKFFLFGYIWFGFCLFASCLGVLRFGEY